jgi:phosphoenolpyruvate-protein kinase (PTS system EI component)
VGAIAAAFYPKPVIVRMSDFKSNEYANLLGGREFEPHEENPMIGWRGASRYYDEKYSEGFALECKAMKRVREEMGLTNVILMIPFCRTPDEGRRVLSEMEKNGLKRGENGLQVYVMCEIPSNVVLADEFADVFDGFSIGSNDLTQLTLGLDRDSALVAHLFDERNTGVKRMIRNVIATAKEKGRKIGICGQAPSDYPEFARFLVTEGIDSISLNPDSVLKTMMAIVGLEETVGAQVGHARGRWEGSTLVAETDHFVDYKMFDGLIQTSDQLTLTERFRAKDRNTLEYRITVIDPATFSQSWETVLTYKRQPDGPFQEDICMERKQAGESPWPKP